MQIVLALLLLLALNACAPHATTIPNVSIGNTGCPRAELAVFGYLPEQRSWTAVCANNVFSCSAVGGTTRCAASPVTPDTPELVRRANLLKGLTPEQAQPFVTENIVALARASFERQVAIATLAKPELLEEVKTIDSIIVLRSKPPKDCTPNTYEDVIIADHGRLMPASPNRQCIEEALKGVAVTPTLEAQDNLVLALTFDESHVQTRMKKIAQEGEAVAATQTSAPSPPSSAEPLTMQTHAASPSPVETEVRSALDARADDLLACVSAPRVLVEANVDPEGNVAVSLRDLPKDDPLQGCARSAMGTLKVAPGALTVVHLVRRQ
jgi:hypothetical protein